MRARMAMKGIHVVMMAAVVSIVIPNVLSQATLISKTRMYGKSGRHQDSFAIENSPNGYWITGETNGFPPFSNTNHRDVLLVRFNSLGDKQCARVIATVGEDRGTSLAIDQQSGTAFVLGTTTGLIWDSAPFSSNGNTDLFVAQIFNNCSVGWVRQFNSSASQSPGGIAFKSPNKLYLAGRASSPIEGLNANVTGDVFVFHLNADNGNVVKRMLIKGDGSDTPEDVSLDSSGNVFVVGSTTSSSLNGVVNPGSTSGFVVKLDAGLSNVVYTTMVGTSLENGLRAMDFTASGALLVTGYTKGVFANGATSKGGNDIIVCQLNSTGGIEWKAQYGTTSDDIGVDIAADPLSSSFFVTGTTNGLFPGYSQTRQFFVIHGNGSAMGTSVWIRQFGGVASVNNNARSLIVHRYQNQSTVLVSGRTDKDWDGVLRVGIQEVFVTGLPMPACQPGSFDFHCQSCAKGQFSNESAALTCHKCGFGKFSTVEGASSISVCMDCLKGKYGSSEGLSACLDCQKGYWGNTTGEIQQSSSCKPCYVGTFNPASGSNSDAACMKCPVGKYNNVQGKSVCTDCNQGTYENRLGSTRCIDCGFGNFSREFAATNNSACLPCPKGEYGPVSIATSCQNCQVGKFKSFEGNGSCVDCPSGTWNNQTRQSVCVNCATGSFSNATGASSIGVCIFCGPGEYSGATGSTGCTKCPLGTFRKESGGDSVASCSDCPRGYYAQTLGQTSCTACPPGKYSSAVKATGFTTCQDCAINEYATFPGNYECTLCPPGRRGNHTGQWECSYCSAGESSLRGKTTCFKCEAGKFSAINGAPRCESCNPKTQVAKEGSFTCTTCFSPAIPDPVKQECIQASTGSKRDSMKWMWMALMMIVVVIGMM